MTLGKAWRSEYKLLAVIGGAAMLGLALTYWQTQPSSALEANKVALSLPKEYTFIEVAPPPGNLFTEGRQIVSRDQQEGETNTPPPEKSGVNDFVLAGIIEQGSTVFAVFVADGKRISLSPGQQDPIIGQLTQVDGNQATTRLPDGNTKQWQLFPVTNPGKSSKEETPSS